MRKVIIKGNVDNTNEEVKGKSSEEEEIKIPKCSRKFTLGMYIEEIKESSIEEEEI